MNQRIQELMAQAGTDTSGKWMSLDHAEKLAQLIVEECTDLVQKHMTRWPEDCELTKQIKQHFGVES